MRNPLQEQLLKSGLVSKGKANKLAHEARHKARQQKTAEPNRDRQEAERVRAEKVARDKALAAERNARRLQHEAAAQAQQLVDAHQVKPSGDEAYRFQADGKIRTLYVDARQRAALAAGDLVIVKGAAGYTLMASQHAEKLRARDAARVVTDHAHEPAPGAATDDDAWYARFEVPDDLMW